MPNRHLIATTLAVLMISACAGADAVAEGDVLPSTPIPADQDPGLAHVHGVGVNPADGDVYAATHFGLWRLPENGDPHRVGDSGHDFMGFTVLGADHFVASGHPVMTEDLPPLLGLIETTDGGQTWRSVSLLGDVDFHALRAAHDAVWGWSSSDGSLLVSTDRHEWDRRSTMKSLLDFVVDPNDEDRLLATVADGLDDASLQHSVDGGRTWRSLDGPALALLAWPESDRLSGVGLDGRLWRSVDGGATWRQEGDVAGRPEAFADTGDRLLLAAGGVIAESRDDGRSWTELYRAADG